MSKLLEFVRFKDCNLWSVATLLENQFNYNEDYELVKIGSFLKRNKTQIIIDDDTEYKRVTIKLYNKGVFLRDREIGKNIGTKKQFCIKEGQFLLSKIDARNGAFGVVSSDADNAIITGNFWTFDVDYNQVNPYFLSLITTTKQFMKFAQSASSGTTGRHYLSEDRFLDVKTPLPSLDIQKQIVKQYQDRINLATSQEQQAIQKEKEIEEYLYQELKIVNIDNKENQILDFIDYKKLASWSYRDLLGGLQLKSSEYDTIKLNEKTHLFKEVFRGKSPKYEKDSKSIILNQKCIRWNDIEIEHGKKVKDDWIQNIDNKFFTKEKDILINSTGDGTIGRATMITKEFENLLYDSHILLLRVNQSQINPLFLTFFINSTLGQKQIENIKSAVATKQTELGINNLKNLQLIIPSKITIQNQIANHIQALKNEIKTLKTEAQKNRELALEEFEKEIFSET